MTDREQYATTAAVWVGSLVLVGVPTMAVVGRSANAVLSRASVPRPPVLLLAVGVLSIAVGLTVATELTRVRLHGFASLHRGSIARTIGRHTVLLVPAVAFLWYAGVTVFSEIAAEVGGSASPAGAVGFGGVALTFVYVAYRCVRAFVDGRREGRTTGRTAGDAE
ncbi:hypothetical protein [Salinarchaeum laminariae]|uniref:hypothetical protein n=1 Tax=Salinarchaeum laminariae TaxID=869888 RepID=UPI0020C0A76E|nr:hypothetical protein [Salinarchaeum laminariae]